MNTELQISAYADYIIARMKLVLLHVVTNGTGVDISAINKVLTAKYNLAKEQGDKDDIPDVVRELAQRKVNIYFQIEQFVMLKKLLEEQNN